MKKETKKRPVFSLRFRLVLLVAIELVGSILLLSKLENQQIPTGQSSFSLDEQIRQTIVALEPL